ncbi:hypothetical protein ACQR1Y_12250 [Bradyrhizobium sp. HKCCYLRH3099]|uniref:hypothetical protein n=1 Tax=unclassified Bradyrhizobium TaxID=2631580 RepID=UPI003EB83602
MQVSAELEVELRKAQQRTGVFFRLGVNPVQRLWTGVGRVAVEDAIDGQAVYRGFGELTNLPALTQLVNGIADRLDFTLSGSSVSAKVLATAAGEGDEVKGAQVDVGLGFFDERWQFVGLIWLYRGEADLLTTSLDAAPGGNVTRAIKLSVGSAMTGRRRTRQSVYSDFDQQSRSPGDRFCERIRRYSEGVAKEWPRY